MLKFINDHSGMAWVYPLRKKSDTYASFCEWKSLVENETGLYIMHFHTDNGGEYTSDTFDNYLHNEGICNQTTTPHTSAENRKAECLYRTIMTCVHAI